MLRATHIPFETNKCDLDRASGSASTITLTKRAGYAWILESIQWDYTSDPVSGSLTVNANGTPVFKQGITSKGPGMAPWANPRSLPSIAAGLTYTIVLADGTSVKNLNVEAREMPEDQL